MADGPALTLVDTSAWVEFLRATGSPVNTRLRELVSRGAPLATTEPIVMELLAGARDEAHLRGLRKLVLGCELLPLRGLADYEEAAALYRACRRGGSTVRRLVDCLIAVVAINSRTALLHSDADFDLIAKHSELALVAPSG